MYRTNSFKKKLLVTAIASTALSGFSGTALAQVGATEEVLVTGIRASVAQAMDVKRNATGVVDAISSEDIGKMPDANLAESLQRITGLSIDRSNGEGSKVAVRGIDPALNMVTLNGRNMPAVTNGSTSDVASRAFDFSNLASEVVSGVEVYKTGNATITSGGLGATININTLRPLDLGQTKATIAAKAVHDETVDNGVGGNDITPELSGLYSWVNDDETFGVALTGAYQERDNTRSNVFVNNWYLQTAGAPTFNAAGDQLTHDGVIPFAATVQNAPANGEIYNLPSDIRYSLEDSNRIRQNGQLTLQYRPVDNLTATLDYTYSENELKADRSQQSTWYNISAISNLVFDDSEVKTPLIYEEAYAPSEGKDVSFAQQYFESKSRNNSIGLNLAYEASDDLHFELDYHNSTAKNVAHQGEAGLNANVVTSNYADFSRDMPVMGVTIDDTYVDPVTGTNGNANGVLDGGDVSGAMGTISYGSQETEIEQLRLMGSYNLGDAGLFTDMGVSFGLEAREDKNQTRIGDGTAPRLTMGNWGGIDPALFGSDWPGYFTPRDFADSFPDFDGTTNAPNFLHGGLDTDPHKVFEKMEYMFNSGIDPTNFKDFPNGKAQWNGILGTNRVIEEEVKSVYVQFKTAIDLAMPTNVVIGMRYEETDVTSTSNVAVPSALNWESDNDWSVILSDGAPQTVSSSASYNNFLPNIDVDFSPTDDIKIRLSYSKTMGRASYNELRSDAGITSAYLRTANAGNAGLKPMESDNYDISAEWYYNDDSYVSLGYFRKEVSNFIGSATVLRDWYDLRDVRNGPRFTQAIADIAAAGGNINSEQEQHNQMLINEGLDPNDPSTSIFADDQDPLLQWVTNTPVNDQDNTIDGLEFAVQHWFGDTGFGVQANYTMVDEAHSFDVSKTGGQFAMLGLSDSANLIGFYDRDAWQVRVAYNWRDEFLNSRTMSGGNEPGYTEEFGQIDFSVAYELNENVSFTVEGLNVTGENSRVHGRSDNQIYSLEDLGARYQVGVRYTY